MALKICSLNKFPLSWWNQLIIHSHVKLLMDWKRRWIGARKVHYEREKKRKGGPTGKLIQKCISANTPLSSWKKKKKKKQFKSVDNSITFHNELRSQRKIKLRKQEDIKPKAALHFYTFGNRGAENFLLRKKHTRTKEDKRVSSGDRKDMCVQCHFLSIE